MDNSSVLSFDMTSAWEQLRRMNFFGYDFNEFQVHFKRVLPGNGQVLVEPRTPHAMLSFLDMIHRCKKFGEHYMNRGHYFEAAHIFHEAIDMQKVLCGQAITADGEGFLRSINKTVDDQVKCLNELGRTAEADECRFRHESFSDSFLNALMKSTSQEELLVANSDKAAEELSSPQESKKKRKKKKKATLGKPVGENEISSAWQDESVLNTATEDQVNEMLIKKYSVFTAASSPFLSPKHGGQRLACYPSSVSFTARTYHDLLLSRSDLPNENAVIRLFPPPLEALTSVVARRNTVDSSV